MIQSEEPAKSFPGGCYLEIGPGNLALLIACSRNLKQQDTLERNKTIIHNLSVINSEHFVLFSEQTMRELKLNHFYWVVQCRCAYFRKLEGAHSRKLIIGVLKPIKKFFLFTFILALELGQKSPVICHILSLFLSFISGILNYKHVILQSFKSNQKLRSFPFRVQKVG